MMQGVMKLAGGTRARNRANRRSILLAAVVVALLSVLALVQGFQLREKNQQYAQTCQELQQKIEAEEARAEQLKEYSEYTKTEDFVKWYAKNRLGLVEDGDIILKSE